MSFAALLAGLIFNILSLLFAVNVGHSLAQKDYKQTETSCYLCLACAAVATCMIFLAGGLFE